MAQSPVYSTDGQLGGLNPFTPNQSAGQDNPNFQVGDVHIATDGSEWLFTLAATTINVGDCVHVDANYNTSQMTNALATAALGTVAWAKDAVLTGTYLWVATTGLAISGSVLTGTAAGVALYTTATAGVLSSTATSQIQIFGVKAAVANSSGSTATRQLIAPAPRTTN